MATVLSVSFIFVEGTEKSSSQKAYFSLVLPFKKTANRTSVCTAGEFSYLLCVFFALDLNRKNSK